MTIDAAQILKVRARVLERSAEIGGAFGTGAPPGFGATLDNAVQGVARVQAEAANAAAAVEHGESSDIASMMLARQKSSLAFQATLQVRNKLLSAYNDIMNMPV